MEGNGSSDYTVSYTVTSGSDSDNGQGSMDLALFAKNAAVVTRQSQQEPKKEVLYKSVICAMAICLGSFHMGATIAYSSPALPNLNNNPNPFHLSVRQVSWVGSLATLAALVGGFVGGPYMDRIGRKMAIMTCTVLFMIGWVIFIASPNFSCMMIGRFVTGACTGIISVTCPIYIGEIAPASIRGLLGSCHQFAVCVGVMFVYGFGAFLSWTWLAIAVGVVLLLLECAMCFIPESPRWLLCVGRRDDAEYALQWLRGKDANVQKEMMELEDMIKTSQDKAALREFLEPQLLKPLMISLGLMLCQQLSGINVIMIYTVDIFRMSQSDLDPNLQTVIVGIVGIVGTLVSVFVADLAGRRILLLVSGFMMTVCMASVGAFFFELEVDRSFAVDKLGWLPVVCLVLYNFGFNVAFGPIPWVMMSELFPLRAKGVAGSVSTAINWLSAFLITRFFVDITEAIHVYGAYWLCTAVCAISIPFIIFVVPETKGKTLEEIQESFK